MPLAPLTIEEAQGIASFLYLSSGDPKVYFPRAELSFVESEGKVFYAFWDARKNPQDQAREPTSSIFLLIQGIHETEALQARKILRNRIFSTARPTELCFGAVKVSAKRLTHELRPEATLAQEDLARFQFVDLSRPPALPIGTDSIHPNSLWKGSAPPSSPQDFMHLAVALSSIVPQAGPRYLSDRKIAALLVSGNNELLAWAVNRNAKNKTFHAEICLLRNFYDRTGQPLPTGAQIFTSLKPCKMCAGAIWNMAQDPLAIRVYFAENDPGRNARSTILDPDSAERRRACSREFEIQARIQQQLSCSFES